MLARGLTYALPVLTFVLLLVGGIVHSTGSSLACPDWPLCYGQFFPRMQGGILYEHSHRLLASAVGVLTLALGGWAWRTGDAAWRKASLLGVGLVLAQGLLGGVTVLLRLPALVSILHFATSMLFFAWTVFVALRLRGLTHYHGEPAHRGLTVALALVYVQLVLGAVVRHSGASLACGLDAALCAGGLWPTWRLQWLQTAHRLGAVIAAAVVVAATVGPMKRARIAGQRRIYALALSTHILVLLQIVLGVLTIKTAVHTHVVTTHLAVGALLWASLAALWLCTHPTPRSVVARRPSINLGPAAGKADGAC